MLLRPPARITARGRVHMTSKDLSTPYPLCHSNAAYQHCQLTFGCAPQPPHEDIIFTCPPHTVPLLLSGCRFFDRLYPWLSWLLWRWWRCGLTKVRRSALPSFLPSSFQSSLSPSSSRSQSQFQCPRSNAGSCGRGMYIRCLH